MGGPNNQGVGKYSKMLTNRGVKINGGLELEKWLYSKVSNKHPTFTNFSIFSNPPDHIRVSLFINFKDIDFFALFPFFASTIYFQF